MASRFWVGGTGTWNGISTAHWSASSGGVAGASAPSSSDNVTIDTNSGFGSGGTITANSATCNDFTSTAAHTYTISGDITIYGSFTGESTTVYTSNFTSFVATSTGKTITTGSASFGDVSFLGNGGGWTLQDNLSMTGEFFQNNGTFTANDKNITATDFAFAGNAGLSPVVNMGSGTWTATNGFNPGGDFWAIDEVTANSVTINPGTSTIKLNMVASGFNRFMSRYDLATGKTYYNLYITGSGTGTVFIEGTNTFNDIKMDNGPHTIAFEQGKTQTVSTFTVNGTAGNLITISSGRRTNGGDDVLSTSTHTLTKTGSGTIVCQYLSIQHSIATPSNVWYTDTTTSINNNSVVTAGSGWNFSHLWTNIPKATGNWTNITKATGTSWTNIAKATGAGSGSGGGIPIGMLLALTYASGSASSIWHNITKATNTSWTNVNKASGTSWSKITKAT